MEVLAGYTHWLEPRGLLAADGNHDIGASIYSFSLPQFCLGEEINTDIFLDHLLCHFHILSIPMLFYPSHLDHWVEN